MHSCRDIFLITVDCLRPDYLGVYNGRPGCSPNIDSLAHGAAVFDTVVSHAPFTTPAMASLMTGVYPFRTGVRLLLGQLCAHGLPTMAEYARRAGFLTAGFPSAFVINSDTGLARGFDVYRDIHEGIKSGRGGCWQPGDRINAAVDQFLHTAGKRSVFCWIHYFDLHDYHLDPSVPIETSYPRDLKAKIDGQCIGGLMDILRRHDRLDQAAIVLTADHGESLNQHGERGHGHHLYDSALRVPMIWRWGDLTRQSGRVNRQVRHVDILPTLLQLLGFPREDWPGRLDGRSVVPLMRALSEPHAAADFRVDPSYAEASPKQLFEGDITAHKPFQGPEQQSLRTERYKLIAHADGRRELYDLPADPGEMKNIAAEQPGPLAECERELRALAGAQPALFNGPTFTAEQERQVRNRLLALGYVC